MSTTNPPQATAAGKVEMPEAVRKEYNEMLRWINDHTLTTSLLYDLDRLPEQLEEGSREWQEMVIIVQHMKAASDDSKASRLPALVAAVDKVLAAWERRPAGTISYKEELRDALSALRALQQEMK